jgi:ATP-dependent DNA ligase
MVCSLDLEGVVAKHRNAPYAPPTRWVKVKNRNYTQVRGRHELFDGRKTAAKHILYD